MNNRDDLIRRSWRTGSASFLILVGAAYGQSSQQVVAADTVVIDFEQTPCDGVPPQIRVVLNGDETHSFSAEKNSAGSWVGNWRRKGTFNAAQATASLRLGNKRTECRPAAWDRITEAEETIYVAKFTFTCTQRAAQQLKIGNDPASLAVSYVRASPKLDKVKDSVDCVEWGQVIDQPTIVRDAWLQSASEPTETIRLQIGRETADPKRPGLLITDTAVLRRLSRDGTLSFEGALEALAEQRNSGVAKMPPLFPSNAYDIDAKTLKAAGLKSLTVQ